MGSTSKKRTTMAKLNRESRLRDKRAEKESRKVARRLTAAREAADMDVAGVGHLDGAPEEDLAGEPDGAAAPVGAHAGRI